MNAHTLTLNERAMLATFNVSMWTARKRDKKITREVAKNHGTVEQVGNYNKRLLPMDSPTYSAVVSAAAAARHYHYEATLPWGQEGARILTAAQYFDYTKRMRELEDQFGQAVSEFVKDYPRLRENAKQLLNGMYRDDDYPTQSNIRRAFAMSRDVFPLPSAADFRVQLGDDQVSVIREQIEHNVAEATGNAMRDLYQRVHDAVAHMAERLGNADAVFRDSLVTNLREIVELLPKLNLTNDPTLEAMGKRLAKNLCPLEPQTLRVDPEVRSKAADEAAAIMAKMAAYMEN